MKNLFLALCLAVFGAANAHAMIQIDLDQPGSEPLPLAVADIYGVGADAALGQKIAGVIRNNFRNSSLFSVLPKKAYLQSSEQVATALPSFGDWRLIKADALLTGQVQTVGDQIQVDFRLYDTYNEKQVVGRRYTVGNGFWRHAGHRISDDIFTALTGEKGYFASRVVHIAENGGQKRLCVMDQDGGNYQCLTDGNSLVLTPRFNPNVHKIIYLSYAKNDLPRLYLLDLPTGRQEILGDFEGLNSSPRFAPDGQSVAMTLTKGHAGNPEIYTMDLATKRLNRLTNHSGIDTSPSFSPDGQRIVFNSDRGGKPALYIMNRDGSGVKRLTFGNGAYYAPVWSPRGDLIAFVKNLGKKFHIGVIDPNGDEERLLTDSYLDESPSWSPNGRVLVFARQDDRASRTRIMSVDLTGYNLREINTPNNASDPAWSPLVD